LDILEMIGFASGVVSVWLAVREKVWSWPIGILNSLSFLVLFYLAGLYANSMLQILYLVLCIVGWRNWLVGGAGATALAIQRVTRLQAAKFALLTVVGAAVFTALLARFTDSEVPFWDGLTVALSMTATYMLACKLVENWLVWIVADLIYVPLYASQGLYLTSAVYLLFLAMCIVGLLRWRRVHALPATA
jgi:nicotinamide mononucleotide transporter